MANTRQDIWDELLSDFDAYNQARVVALLTAERLAFLTREQALQAEVDRLKRKNAALSQSELMSQVGEMAADHGRELAQARLDGLREGFHAGVGLEWNHMIGGKVIWRFNRPSEYDESELDEAFAALVLRTNT